jgi:hypothetical protein
MEKFEVRTQRLCDAKSCGEDGVVAAPAPANTSMFFMLVCSDMPSSMRYQNRDFRIAQNPLGEAAEDPLAKPAVAVAAHH